MQIRVLGSAAGGGFPQWNCGCPNCRGVRAGTIAATLEMSDEHSPEMLLIRFRHPERKPMQSATVNGVNWKDFDPAKEWVRVPHPKERRYQIVAGY